MEQSTQKVPQEIEFNCGDVIETCKLYSVQLCTNDCKTKVDTVEEQILIRSRRNKLKDWSNLKLSPGNYTVKVRPHRCRAYGFSDDCHSKSFWINKETKTSIKFKKSPEKQYSLIITTQNVGRRLNSRLSIDYMDINSTSLYSLKSSFSNQGNVPTTTAIGFSNIDSLNIATTKSSHTTGVPKNLTVKTSRSKSTTKNDSVRLQNNSNYINQNNPISKTSRIGTSKVDTGLNTLSTVVISFVCLLLFCLVLYMMRWKRKAVKPSKEKSMSQPRDEADQISTNMTGENTVSKPPCVYIISTDDHNHHRAAVDALTRFLQESKCDVTCVPWDFNDRFAGHTSFLGRYAAEANFVIFVNSKLASHYCNLSKSGKTGCLYEPESRSPPCDINCVADVYLNASSDFSNKRFIQIDFGYTPNPFCFDFLQSSNYRIPENLQQFLCHILNSTEDFNELISSSHGQCFMQKITEAREFEMDTPDWINRYLHKILDRQDSGIDSPIASLEITHELPRLSHVHEEYTNRSHANDLGFDNFPNNLNDGLSRQRSVEDNTQVVDSQSEAFDCSRAYTSPPNNFFEAPSEIGDDEVESQQLRQEIYELNHRMLTAHYRNGYVVRGISREDEIISLGGQSV